MTQPGNDETTVERAPASRNVGCPVRVLFHSPEIPQNTGSTIRLSALTGVEFHVAGPVAFDFSDARLKRAGLDYHDLAHLTLHDSLEAAYAELLPARVFAFTARAERLHSEVEWRPGDVLLFGRESSGLDEEVMADPRVTERVRIPMLPGLRSLNLATATGIAVYEAWRQSGWTGTE